MAFNLYSMPTSDDEQAQVAWLMLLFAQARNRRVNYEVQWEEAAAICWPAYRNSFSFGHVRAPGVKYTEFQLDSTGPIASHRFMAICDFLITPYTMRWSYVKPSNKDLLKDRSIALYYQQLNNILWYNRYRSDANFFSQNQLNWQCLGVFGNMGMYIDEIETQKGHYAPGLRYMATSPGEMYKLRNYQGRVDGFIRHFRWSARQAYQRWGDKIPAVIGAALETQSQEPWDFLQFCLPNTEYDPLAIFDWRGKPYISVYVSVAGFCILERDGYRMLPWSSGGYQLAPEEEYERGPGQMVLPSLKTLNSEKGMFLRQGHKAAEPAWLLADDGVTSLRTEPNAFNFGGLNASGEPMVKPLEAGSIQITQEMMLEEQKSVNDAFLVSLFPLLNPDNKGSPTDFRQFMEAAAQRGIFLGPTLGKQYSDYVPGIIDRELDVLSRLRLLPKRPPALKEAKAGQDYQHVYCSPLAQALEGQVIAGFARSVQMANEVVQMTGDQSVMDAFEFDEALADISEYNFVPVNWMATPDKIAQKRQARQQSQERENQVKELPGKAAIMKAQAINSKAQAGQNIGGVLSGTAQGGMPMMPGQTQPGGRTFGQPG